MWCSNCMSQCASGLLSLSLQFSPKIVFDIILLCLINIFKSHSKVSRIKRLLSWNAHKFYDNWGNANLPLKSDKKHHVCITEVSGSWTCIIQSNLSFRVTWISINSSMMMIQVRLYINNSGLHKALLLLKEPWKSSCTLPDLKVLLYCIFHAMSWLMTISFCQMFIEDLFWKPIHTTRCSD